ncbi:MAG: hypothetical protein CMN05_08885 [Roseibacillus sp.]|jgi:hypothetical protein|nr:hypothetical protein [Roseibacillus sp.]MBP35784.1 hypothetical protein [Roseibacillus sp.]MCP4731058.1 hypothetical protein [Roseibacillus sp.]MDP7308347.1 PGPGW domain-containing protein [Roseibacillus sp.]HJM63457.1 PGPGW domain-containing protein [Roseibacillus sp.]|tara:strand:- start:16534 stop:16950 length:417 start_codon:yes stop_codon:yes gene_type:complete
MIEWFRDHEALLWFLGVFSAVSVVMAIFLTPWAISLLSADYFMPGRDRTRTFGSRHPMIRWTGLILKNVGGAALVISGIALLALPGQGLLTILVGLALMNFPGKRALELWLIRLPMVLRAVNWIRRKGGREPLQVPPT